MDLLLVRCADLETDAKSRDKDGKESAHGAYDRMDVALSSRGVRHSRRLAAWLKNHAPQHLQIVSSPAKGAREMADIIAADLKASAMPPIVSRLLGPKARASDVLGAVGWPHDHHAALVVAHQPALGELASLLLTGEKGSLPFKRGAIWWFSNRHRGGEEQTVLRCTLPPDLLKGSLRSVQHEALEPPRPFSLPLPDVVSLMRARLETAVR